MSRRRVLVMVLGSMLAACGASGPADSVPSSHLGATIVGASRSDLWAVSLSGTTLTLDHYDGGSWHQPTIPASLVAARMPFTAISGGAHALWVAMPADTAGQPFVLVRVNSDGTSEDRAADLPMATSPSDEIRLFGRGGSAVVQIVPTTGSAQVFRYDGAHFVSVPALPSDISEVVCAPGGTDIWARAAVPGVPEEAHYRFDGSAWQTVATTTVPTTVPWTATGADNVWAPTGMPGSPMVHWDGAQFTTLMIPREDDAAGGMANQAETSVVAGVVATSGGRGVELLLHTIRDAANMVQADLAYRTLTGQAAGLRRSYRLHLENDAHTVHGFRGTPAGVYTMDDGSTVAALTVMTDTTTTGFLYVAGPGSLQ